MSGANIAMLEYAELLKEDYDLYFILPHEGNMNGALVCRNFGMDIIPQYGWASPIGQSKVKHPLRFFIRSAVAVLQTCILIRKHNISLVFTNTQIPFTASIAAKLMFKPHVWWLHEFGEEDFGFSIGGGNRKRALRWMNRSSKLIIGNSEAVAEKFRTLLPSAIVKRLYQPVSFFLKTGTKLYTEEKAYLMFGQLIPSKGHMQVLEALQILKGSDNINGITLRIAGPAENDKYPETLFLYIAEHRLEAYVKITPGYFKKEEILPGYKALIVSSEAEAFGRVVIEAGKAGLKVIVKNSGGSPELVNDTNGVLYNTTEELSRILSGEIKLPSADTVFNYDEEEEMNKLDTWLKAIA